LPFVWGIALGVGACRRPGECGIVGIRGSAMRIYLDNCCYNRPFDDQNQKKIQLETIAKLYIQNAVRNGVYDLVWSFMNDI
jgi:hypothetical protein